MGYQISSSVITILLLDLLKISIAWKLMILLFIGTDIKTFPLVWHIRLLNALRFVLPSQRAEHGPTPDSIFSPLVTSSHCSLSEIDFNWHKSNSTYYSDLDISRTHLLCTLFSAGIDQARHKHGNGLLKLQKGSFTIKLGGVQCSFKREIKPYQRYEMWTRVLSWDTKWLYTITHFVRKDAKIKQDIVCATAVSKCVFKSGRRTIAPEVMLQTSGLLPQKLYTRPLLSVAIAAHPLQRELPRGEEFAFAPQTNQYESDPLQPTDLLDGNEWINFQNVEKSQMAARWTSEMIENERRRGMGMVSMGDLDDLEQEFLPDVDLLGRHFDL